MADWNIPNQRPVYRPDITDPELVRRILPTGGAAGMSLIKSASADYTCDWVWFTAVPPYGTRGQTLTKMSDTSGDIGWETKAIAMYNSQVITAMSVGTKIPFNIAIHNNNAGILFQGGGTFRLEQGKTYDITASVNTNFGGPTDNVTYYVYTNETATGCPSVQVPFNIAVPNSYSNIMTAIVAAPFGSPTDVSVRCQAVTGTASAAGYTNYIKFVEI